MNAVNHLETKQKIIETAKKLFSENSFEGTSIRKIAELAEVNVAAVNYHFGTKDQLFVTIIESSTKGFEDDIKIFYEDYKKNKYSAEDFFISLSRYFLKNSLNIVSTMKVIMSANHSQKMTMANVKKIENGPPGVEYFNLVFKDQFKNQISEENLHWASTTMFSHLIHKTIIMCTCITDEDKQNSNLYCSEKDFEKGVTKLYHAIFNYLQTLEI